MLKLPYSSLGTKHDSWPKGQPEHPFSVGSLCVAGSAASFIGFPNTEIRKQMCAMPWSRLLPHRGQSLWNEQQQAQLGGSPHALQVLTAHLDADYQWDHLTKVNVSSTVGAHQASRAKKSTEHHTQPGKDFVQSLPTLLHWVF